METEDRNLMNRLVELAEAKEGLRTAAKARMRVEFSSPRTLRRAITIYEKAEARLAQAKRSVESQEAP